MKIITGKNSSGKTKELIKYSLDTSIPIFALTESKKNSLIEKSITYFDQMVKVVLPSDLLQENDCTTILVDDIEKVCTKLIESSIAPTTLNIIAATITEE